MNQLDIYGNKSNFDNRTKDDKMKDWFNSLDEVQKIEQISKLSSEIKRLKYRIDKMSVIYVNNAKKRNKEANKTALLKHFQESKILLKQLINLL